MATPPESYPHDNYCEHCRERGLCAACGAKLDATRCSAERCARCHRLFCTNHGDSKRNGRRRTNGRRAQRAAKVEIQRRAA